ncbi:MAG: hypothetical protein ACOCY8_07940 [Spirochaetota bacterium]
MDPKERPIADYLQDIRHIRETMLRAEDRLHAPAWFFFIMSALVAVGTIAHAVVEFATDAALTTKLLAVWLPLFLLGGVAEASAWIVTTRREGLPWLSPNLGRFFATVGGVLIAVSVIGVTAVLNGASGAGVILVISACVFLAYVPYSPSATVWIGWVLLAPGLGFVLAGVAGTPATLFAAGLVVTAFFVAGVAERRSRTHG